MVSITNRGALIVLEGCDRAGKTTQCKKLVESLRMLNHKVEYINFPDRTTSSGKLIDDYLTRKSEFSDQGIHLLFSLNRWEAKNKMEKMMLNGTTLIVDRYSYSGVAFSAAKGLDLEWCKAPEKGLLKPDLVLYLELNAKAMIERGGFGKERYEIPELQKKVIEKFDELKEDAYWKTIDADKNQEKLNMELTEIAKETIKTSETEDLKLLW